MWAWLFDLASHPGNASALAPLFDIALQAGLSHGHAYTNADRSAAAVWAPPDVNALGRTHGEALAALVQERCGDAGLSRLSALASGTRAAHPAESHFYLFLVGVHAQRRSEGLGAEILSPLLQVCDTQGWPAYLESSNPRNLSFYHRLGFEARGEIELANGPVMTAMWRESRREI